MVVALIVSVGEQSGLDFSYKEWQYESINIRRIHNMSQTITLRDDRFQVIGYVEIEDNGDKTLKDERFQVLGYYDARYGMTKDERFQVVGHGDILTSLLR